MLSALLSLSFAQENTAWTNLYSENSDLIVRMVRSYGADAGWSSGAMVARYARALSGELAAEEFQRSWCLR
jgi:hypothetical protein